MREGGQYRLRTLAYAYRIAEGPTFDDQCLFRWEYNAREHKQSLAPRHHLQLPATIKCFENRELDANKLHIPSGWVTVEEVIRRAKSQQATRGVAVPVFYWRTAFAVERARRECALYPSITGRS